MKRVQFKHKVNEKSHGNCELIWTSKKLKSEQQYGEKLESIEKLRFYHRIHFIAYSQSLSIVYDEQTIFVHLLYSLFTFFRCLKNIRPCKCFVDGMNSCVTNFFLLLKDNCTQLSVHILHNMLVSTLLFLSDVPSHRKRAMDKK